METQLIIDNQALPASGNATYVRLHPTTGSAVTRAAAASVGDAVAAVESAHRAFQSWSQSGPTERRRILLKAADILESKTPQFIETMAKEIGASELWSGFNVMLAANLFREAAALATQIQGETIPTDKPGALSMTVRQPVGVILSIVPWNGPVVLAARAIAYPIICGNSVVFRASETSPRTHLLIAEALVEAGLPPGVLNVLTNDPSDAAEVVDALISHKAVRRINFTGSTRIGRIIAEKAGRHLKRCLLELGGKSPLVVLDDADIDEAVKAAVFGAFLLLTGATMPWMWIAPDMEGWLLMVGLGVLSGAGQYLLFEGFRLAPASAIGPCEYTALAWAFLLGYLIWSDVPSESVFLGAGLIVLASVVLVVSEHRRSRRGAAGPAITIPVRPSFKPVADESARPPAATPVQGSEDRSCE